MPKSAPNHQQSPRPVVAHPTAAALWCGFLVSMTVLIVASGHPMNGPSSEPEVPATEVVPAEIQPRRDVVRASFFDKQVVPQIDATDALNRQAAQRCVQRIERLMDRYRDGVGPFARDLTSISTRLGIVRRMPGDWWKRDHRIEHYVQEKFERHLFSQLSLKRDVAEVLKSFRNDVDANQNRMLVHVRASLDRADLPEVDLDDYEPFFRSVATQLRSYAAQQGATSVYNGLTTLIISEAGGVAAISLVSGILVRFGSAVAASTAAGAGATVTASAAGAGGGSVVGPVGTVVGLGVGLGVGLVIDWWMTDKFEEKLVAQMTEFIDSLEQSILHGSAVNSLNQSAPALAAGGQGGLNGALPAICDRLQAAYRERFFQQIVINEGPR